eukprot:5631806-Heterocapsa_arctica.AAC.1
MHLAQCDFECATACRKSSRRGLATLYEVIDACDRTIWGAYRVHHAVGIGCIAFGWQNGPPEHQSL